MPNPAGGALLIGILFWIGGYFLHRNECSVYPRIKAPKRIRLLFGDFRSSGTLSVLGVAVQAVSYLLVMGGLVAEAMIPDPHVRGAVLVVWLFGLLLLGGIFRIVASHVLKQ